MAFDTHVAPASPRPSGPWRYHIPYVYGVIDEYASHCRQGLQRFSWDRGRNVLDRDSLLWGLPFRTWNAVWVVLAFCLHVAVWFAFCLVRALFVHVPVCVFVLYLCFVYEEVQWVLHSSFTYYIRLISPISCKRSQRATYVCHICVIFVLQIQFSVSVVRSGRANT